MNRQSMVVDTALCMPMVFYGVAILERRAHLLPDIVAIPYVLLFLFCVPASLVCGVILLVRAYKQSHKNPYTLLRAVLGVGEIAVGIAMAIFLSHVKFITPQT